MVEGSYTTLLHVGSLSSLCTDSDLEPRDRLVGAGLGEVGLDVASSVGAGVLDVRDSSVGAGVLDVRDSSVGAGVPLVGEVGLGVEKVVDSCVLPPESVDLDEVADVGARVRDSEVGFSVRPPTGLEVRGPLVGLGVRGWRVGLCVRGPLVGLWVRGCLVGLRVRPGLRVGRWVRLRIASHLWNRSIGGRVLIREGGLVSGVWGGAVTFSRIGGLVRLEMAGGKVRDGGLVTSGCLQFP